ncbi:SusD/RagB family nutrient-binding outer membrane lipoprotein [Chitinophaga caseinilytica]|uniref:SusD/RagB family nutrient-binding outer membrane lipoprotein n=1 Tax=Chitinophaga caseinilytica TaxID=2267521 RepID=A0ABZ2Z3I5_9BACT
MKHTIIGALVLFGMATQSCTKDFTEINTNPNETKVATAHALMAPALVNTLSANMIRNRNFNNELMQVTVDISESDGKVFRYDFRATWADYLYNAWYSELTNFKDMEKVARDPKSYNRSYIGISLICQAWVFSMLTDTYGDIPYFKSNLARDSAVFEPPFDTQKDIYFDIFNKLDTANVYLNNTTYGINANSDPVFNGDITKWRRFGNSLYLRLLMRISGKAEVADVAIAKFKEVAETKKSSYPIIDTTEQSAILRWTGAGPLVSPFLGVREQDFRGPGVGEFFINNLVNWNNPLIDPSKGNNSVNRWRIAPYQGGYSGVPSGYQMGQAPVRRSYFYSQTTTTLFNLQTDALTGQMLNAAEVQFMLAEAVVKGWIAGSAEAYYTRGIKYTIKQWIPAWDEVTDYIDKADLHWNDSGSEDEKMEAIHIQKYYAMFLMDMQQWFEYRRTGHPVLPKGPGLRNNGVMPARMNYPVYVQSTNPTNYKQAVSRQGSDVISTEVWWQKP